MHFKNHLHSDTDLRRLQRELGALVDACNSEALIEVQYCRTLAQRSYPTHSVVIPAGPLVISSADAQGIWVSALVFLPTARPNPLLADKCPTRQ